ncbi:MAG TPA: LON peptidase substrate-binding domain-containing protein [Thermoanaerobaculia bacterium]|nr:LON peptidase substrate-binding domain-containing protein [Thermoanaerobaculia bacterium]
MQPIPDGEFTLRLFPLPNLVFFPATRLPLHVFEPRYRQLVSEALATDERIGMVLLKEGWEGDYYGNPPIHPVGTLGRIEQSVRLEDGRYNLLLGAEVRFRIVGENEPAPYRTARAIAHPETTPPAVEAWGRREWLVELARRYLEMLPGRMDVPELETAGLEALTNALAMSLNVPAAEKQGLLELDDLLVRSDRVASLLEERLEQAEFLGPFRRETDPNLN